MRSPARRSRKIGLTQGGRVKDGRPQEKLSRAFTRSTWERLSQADLPLWHVIRENPSRDFFHPVKREDIHGLLAQLPERVTRSVRAIILRRLPKIDEALAIDARLRCSCVILNAFPRSLEMRFPSNPGPATRRHYRPWTGEWVRDGDEWILRWTVDALKPYYLQHLLLHEIGHLHQPATSNVRRRESFAENFALEWGRRLARSR